MKPLRNYFIIATAAIACLLSAANCQSQGSEPYASSSTSATFEGSGNVQANVSATSSTWYEDSDGEKIQTKSESSIEVTTKLRNAVISTNVVAVSTVLSSNDEEDALARGFTFEQSERSVALTKTKERETDRDVVSMKGIAKSALISQDAEKLAAVMVLSTLEKRDPDVEYQLVQVLRDEMMMRAVVDADPRLEFLPPGDKASPDSGYGQQDPSPSPSPSPSPPPSPSPSPPPSPSPSPSSGWRQPYSPSPGWQRPNPPTWQSPGNPSPWSETPTPDSPRSDRRVSVSVSSSQTRVGRRLQCDGCSPVNSYVCANCWPNNMCKSFHWC